MFYAAAVEVGDRRAQRARRNANKPYIESNSQALAAGLRYFFRISPKLLPAMSAMLSPIEIDAVAAGEGAFNTWT